MIKCHFLVQYKGPLIGVNYETPWIHTLKMTYLGFFNEKSSKTIFI